MKKKVQVRIFSKKNPPKDAVTVQYGVPYLIINDPAQANASDTESKAIYIRLQPAKFSKNSKLYSPLRALTVAVRSMEVLGQVGFQLGTIETESLVTDYAHSNYEINSLGELVKKATAVRLSEFIDVSKSAETEETLEGWMNTIVESIYGGEQRVKYYADEAEAKSLVGTTLEGKKIVSYNVKGTLENPRYTLNYASDINSDDAKVYQH